MDEELENSTPQRGTALLVIAMVFVAFTFAFLVFPRAFGPPEITVKVAIIDSGVTPDEQISFHLVAERSFINQTYGYSTQEDDTLDSEPYGKEHGSAVARIVIKEAPNAGIINAKVINGNDFATAKAVIAAISWAVEEHECDIINLSLGAAPTNSDGIQETIQWAHRLGVVIVAAAGNNGQDGITGSSVESPAIYPEVIAVTAIDELGQLSAYAGYGPTSDRGLKPDISASGRYDDGTFSLVGTSAAAPIVTAAAANLIRFCQDNNWRWTPGMIKATLLASASYLGSEPWQVGAGKINLEQAKRYLESAEKLNDLPLVAWIAPNQGIFDFERWFLNTTYKLQVQVFASSNASFAIRVTGGAAQWVITPESIQVNETGIFFAEIRVVSSLNWKGISATIALVSKYYRTISTKVIFDVTPFSRKVAFDFTHTTWWIDSIYGQFRSFYSLLSESGIAIEEIRNPAYISYEYLRQYDAIVILDPGAWEFSELGNRIVQTYSIPYTEQQLSAYRTYWEKGGHFLVSGGDNGSLDLRNANKLMSIFNISINYDKLPLSTIITNGIANAVQIVNINPNHFVTERVSSFDYHGASLNPGSNSTSLAYEIFQWIDDQGATQTALKPVLVAVEGRMSARAIVTGTNFFFDNWGLNEMYGAEDDSRLLLGCIYWIMGIFE